LPSQRFLRAFTAILLSGTALMPMSVPAMAAADPSRLGISAVGQGTVFFDLAMAPGEKRHVSVDLVNDDTEPIGVLTYAADAYTIVNGGFGVALRGGTATGTTTWLDYPTDSFSLAPKQPLRRYFTVSVPASASPGDYVTSLVLENQEPIRGSGGVALNQIVRHALAMSISIPGPRSPALQITSAAYVLSGGGSVVAIAVENPGNSNLKPSGDFRLFAASGREVNHSPITMGSFYAMSATHVEIPLVGQLQPGHYLGVLALSDTGTGLRITSGPLPIEVVGSPAPLVGLQGRAPVQGPGGGIPVWIFAAAIGCALVAGVVGALFLPMFWRRRASHAFVNRAGK
jgi:hypothetical protein